MAGVPVRQDICRWLRAHPAVRQISWRARTVLPVVAGLLAQSLRGGQRGLAAGAADSSIRATSLTSDVDDQLALGGVIPDQSVGIANTLQREAPCIDQRRELVCAPAQRAHHMAKTAHGFEGCIEHLAADGVVDDVEAAAAGMLCNV